MLITQGGLRVTCCRDDACMFVLDVKGFCMCSLLSRPAAVAALPAKPPAHLGTIAATAAQPQC